MDKWVIIAFKESDFIIEYRNKQINPKFLHIQLIRVSASNSNGKKWIQICCIAFASMFLYQPPEKVLLGIVVIALETILPFQ